MSEGSDRETRAEKWLERALELPAAERDAYLDAACEGDPDLRREISELLPFAEDDSDFLTSPVPRPAVLYPSQPMALEVGDAAGAAADAVPEKIGSYRIVRILGYGGMAVVYEALQDHPRRTVALKLLCSAPSTEPLLRRFASEAELMGRLHHPGIAQIFEAGQAQLERPEGTVYRLPFLAMEYVRGERLDRWAARKDSALRDRLRLFAEVCDAVEHAHQQGVLHRDLKPANILVDETGHPKILDFGIARAVERGSQASPPLTASGQILGTLAYMSPEQLDAGNARIDALSDVYALGVILFQVLAGRPPYDVHHLGVAEAALLIGQTKAVPLGSVDRALSGDLETIVAKAMAKGRERRYRGAAQLAADVRRYLAGQPIRARPASRWYRLRKFVYRNRALVGGALATLLALAVGAVVAVHLALDRAELSAELAYFVYCSAIAAAIDALENGDRPLARQALLAKTLAQVQKGWEWHHLWARAQSIALEAEAEPWVLDHGESAVRALAWSPSGEELAAGTSRGEIVLWDPLSYRRITGWRGHAGELLSLAWSGDGTRLVSTSRAETIVWDLSTGVNLASRSISDDRVAVDERAAAFSPDDQRIATGGRDAKVRLWDGSRLEQVALLRGHAGYVRALAWSPDGMALASASDDGTVRIWDLLSAREQLAIRRRRHQQRVYAEALVASLLQTSADYERAITRLRVEPSLDEGLRREIWWESLRRSAQAREVEAN